MSALSTRGPNKTSLLPWNQKPEWFNPFNNKKWENVYLTESNGENASFIAQKRFQGRQACGRRFPVTQDGLQLAARQADHFNYLVHGDKFRSNFPPGHPCELTAANKEDILKMGDLLQLSAVLQVAASNESSLFYGVSKSPNGWMAKVSIDGKLWRHEFRTEKAAAKARDAYCIAHGRTTKLNFPDDV